MLYLKQSRLDLLLCVFVCFFLPGCAFTSKIEDSFIKQERARQEEETRLRAEQVDFSDGISQAEASALAAKYILDESWPKDWPAGGCSDAFDKGDKWVVKYVNCFGVIVQESNGICVDKRSGKISREAEELFGSLKAKWDLEVKQYDYSSNTHDYWQGEAGEKIIAMGKKALPFIMEELEQGNFFFNVPAEIITGKTLEAPSAQETSKKWLEWWEENKNDPEWTICIENMIIGDGP